MKIFLYIKKYWKLTTILLITVLGFFFFKKKSTSLGDRLKELDAAHKVEISKIEAARNREKSLKEESEKKYSEALVHIKSQYDLEKIELTNKKQNEIRKIVHQHGNDPQELAHQLSKATGFKVILPED